MFECVANHIERHRTQGFMLIDTRLVRLCFVVFLLARHDSDNESDNAIST